MVRIVFFRRIKIVVKLINLKMRKRIYRNCNKFCVLQELSYYNQNIHTIVEYIANFINYGVISKINKLLVRHRYVHRLYHQFYIARPNNASAQALSVLRTYLHTRVPDSSELASLCRRDLNSQCDTRANLYPPVTCSIYEYRRLRWRDADV